MSKLQLTNGYLAYGDFLKLAALLEAGFIAAVAAVAFSNINNPYIGYIPGFGGERKRGEDVPVYFHVY